MSGVVFEGMYGAMMKAAKSHGPNGIAFCMPIEPQELAEDCVATVYMFHSDIGDYADKPSRILSVFAGLACERAVVSAGHQPRDGNSAW